jgi:sugar-specific transcriptional regulator TrmB
MTKIEVSNYSVLMKLGLNKTAVSCYEKLFELGGVSVAQLAENLELPRTGLYRVLKQLETKGFLSSVRAASQPTYFFATPLHKALENYAHYQRQAVRDLINEQKEILMKRCDT